MACQTLLLEFSLSGLDPSHAMDKAISVLRQTTGCEFTQLHSHTHSKVESRLYSFDENLLILRFYTVSGLMTISVEGPWLCPSGSPYKDGCLDNDSPPVFETCADIIRLEEALKSALVCGAGKSWPPLTRGLKDSPYITTTEERLVEYPIQELLFEAESQYQTIQIFQTRDFGRMLVLDGQVNLAESDHIYTTQMVGSRSLDGEDVLILGGGDGAIVHHLVSLKKPPQKITMVELDEMVMSAVATWMPTVCGNVLRKRQGPNYQVICGDGLAQLTSYQQSGQRFHLILLDLTDVPIDVTESNSNPWAFMEKILQLSLKCLRPNGRIRSHVTGKANISGQLKFQEVARAAADSANIQIELEVSEAFVPSFMEMWTFAEIAPLSSPRQSKQRGRQRLLE